MQFKALDKKNDPSIKSDKTVYFLDDKEYMLISKFLAFFYASTF